MWVGKLAPPQTQVFAVRRDILLERLTNHSRGGLVLVLSPPGFGKTTLLAQWRAALLAAQPARAVAWLSLDEADADANGFLAHLVLAFDAAGVSCDSLAQRARAQGLDPDPQRNLLALLNALTAQAQRVTLILDDYHRAASAAVDEVVLRLIEHSAPTLELVIASRFRPAWPVATLKARGMLHEIDAGDLVLSLSEAAAILGPEFDRPALSVLHARTEGWAVAVQLARLWIARAGGSAAALQSLSGHVDDIAEYLAGQIVETLPQECRDFLIETSLLERFNADLADQARGRSDSARILAQLTAFDALIVPLDATRTWFRYHLMLAEYLRTRLESRRARQIHRAAARWFSGHRDWVPAVAHALRADDTALAVDLMQTAGGWKLVLAKGIASTKGLLRQFDELTRRTEPGLLLIQAYLHAKLGDMPLATELLRLAEGAVADDPVLRPDFDVIQALVSCYTDRMDDIVRLPATAEAAQAHWPGDALAQATLLCVRSMVSCGHARMDDALAAAQAARGLMRLMASPLGENYSLLHIAQAHGVSGRIADARRVIDEALHLADSNFGTESSLKALVGCFKSQQLYWLGQWPQVQPLLQASLHTVEHVDGWLDLFAVTSDLRWRLALREEGMNAALAALDRSAQLARGRSLPRLVALVDAWRVDLSCQCSQPAQARQEARAAGLQSLLESALLAPEARQDWRYIEAAAVAMVRLHLVNGAARAALVCAESATAWLVQRGLHLPGWRLQLLSLVARRRLDPEAVSSTAVRVALEPVLVHELWGLLLDVGVALLPCLSVLEGPLPPPLLAVVTQLRGWHTHPVRRHSQFTAKEHEVLALLVDGSSNKVIAQSLGVSDNTVKFHLKQIFKKLDVDSRAAAISLALQRGIGSLG